MKAWGRFFALLGVVGLSSVLLGQQGEGGGMMGDAQESMGVFPGSEASGALRQFTKKSFLLTSGDKVTVTIPVKKGQILFVKAESQVFDATLEILDENGKSLAKNDDQYEGEQAPYIALPIPSEGTYKIVVNNYRSNAGGQFKLFTKLSSLTELGLGVTKVKYKRSGENHGSEDLYVAMKLEKGKFYVIGAPDMSLHMPMNRIIGPSGVAKDDFDEYSIDSAFKVIEAKADGVYLGAFSTFSDEQQIDIRFQEIEVMEAKEDFTLSRMLNPYHAILLKTKLQPNTISLLSDASPQGVLSRFTPPGLKKIIPSYNYAEVPVKMRGIYYNLSYGKAHDLVRYSGDGGLQNHFFFSKSDKPQKIELNQSLKVNSIALGETIGGFVDRGQAKPYALKVKSGEVYKIEATSDDFEPQLIIAQDVNSYMNLERRENHRPGLTFIAEKDENVLIVITSLGGGGKGKYELITQTQKPLAYSLGTKQKFSKNNFGLTRFEVDLKANEIYRLQSTATSSVSLKTSDGVEISSQSLFFNGSGSLFFQAKTDGKYVLRINHDNEGDFTLTKANL